MHEIYLNHADTAPLHPDVMGLIMPFFGYHYGTPANPSCFSDTPRQAVRDARERVARLIGALSEEIVFTSGGTEAANMAILGAARAGKTGHIITSSVEQACVLLACRHLEEEGFCLTCLPVDASGLVDPAAVEDAIRDDTVLITIMHANHEVGTVEPISDIGLLAKRHGITFHCDAVQSAGKLPIDVNVLQADLVSFSSHMLYGPKGVGALYVKKGTAISPIFFGAGQEKGLRPGTLNVPGIVGFGKACEIAGKDLEKNAGLTASLRDALEQALLERIPGARVNAPVVTRAPHILSMSFEGIQGDALAAWLDLEGITAATSASLFARHPSHVLTAMGIPADLAFSSVRFSPGWENTKAQIVRTADVAAAAVRMLREFSQQVGDDEICIVTFPGREEAKLAVAGLKEKGIPFAVTARPVELSHLVGPQIAVAIALSHEGRAGALLGERDIAMTGIHRLKGLSRQRTVQEELFWEKVARIRKGKD